MASQRVESRYQFTRTNPNSESLQDTNGTGVLDNKLMERSREVEVQLCGTI